MSNQRLTEIAERIDELNTRMGECLDQWWTPALEVEMAAMEKEYDLLFAEAESLGVKA